MQLCFRWHCRAELISLLVSAAESDVRDNYTDDVLVLRDIDPSSSRTHDVFINDVQLYSRDGTHIKTLVDYTNYSTASSWDTYSMRLGPENTLFLGTFWTGVQILNYANR